MGAQVTEDWKAKTYRLSWLRMKAAEYDHFLNQKAWLKTIGLLPEDEDFTGMNWLPSTNLNPAAIPARYIAEVANEWDAMGPSSPSEFINALSFECAGTPQRDVVSSLLAALGAVIQQDNALAA